jgi:DNA-binding LacI/PurR family transcriptional regulator
MFPFRLFQSIEWQKLVNKRRLKLKVQNLKIISLVIGLNLKNRKTKTIGVIIPNILNSFSPKYLVVLRKVAESKGTM